MPAFLAPLNDPLTFAYKSEVNPKKLGRNLQPLIASKLNSSVGYLDATNPWTLSDSGYLKNFSEQLNRLEGVETLIVDLRFTTTPEDIDWDWVKFFVDFPIYTGSHI